MTTKGLDLLEASRAALIQLCVEYGVHRLHAFGSILREDFDEVSDIDLLVEFSPTVRVGLFHLIRLQHALEDLLDRKVDLVPREGLKPGIREEVLRSARRVYAA